MKTTQLHDWVSRTLDNDLSEFEFSKLEQHLIESKEARAYYKAQSQLHALVGLELDKSQSPHNQLAQPVIQMDQVLLRQKKKTLKIAAMAAAAVVLITLISMSLFFIEKPASSLAFETSPGSVFTLTHPEPEGAPSGRSLQTGSRLQLEQGSVELTFDSGVKSIVLAPADLTLHAADQLFLNHGSAWFDVPKNAVGFTVKTNELEVIDLGTQFGVYSNKNDYDEVHVFKGSVIASSLRLKDHSVTLKAGQARRLNSIGSLLPIPAKQSDYLTSLPTSLPHIRWTFDSDFKASGTHPDAADIITKQHNGPSRSIGKKGTALSLNGKHQSLSTNWPGFAGNRPRTASFWVKFPEGADFTINPACINWGDGSQGNRKWKILLAQSKPNGPTYLRLSWGGTWINGKTHLEPNRWYHVLATSSDKPNKKGLPAADLYLDFQAEAYSYQGFTGIPKNKGMNTSIHTRNAHPLLIGRSIVSPKNIPTFQGEIDELTIYDGYMTPSDVQTLQNTQPYTPLQQTYEKNNTHNHSSSSRCRDMPWLLPGRLNQRKFLRERYRRQPARRCGRVCTSRPLWHRIRRWV